MAMLAIATPPQPNNKCLLDDDDDDFVLILDLSLFVSHSVYGCRRDLTMAAALMLFGWLPLACVCDAHGLKTLLILLASNRCQTNLALNARARAKVEDGN
jgi:hypothetical protein